MKLHILCDLHIGSSKELIGWDTKNVIEFDKECQKRNETVILAGDTIDFKHVLKKQMSKYRLEFQQLTKQFGNRLVLGNHEGKVNGEYSYCVNIKGKNIYVEHGHRFFWIFEKGYEKGLEKIKRWETKEFKGERCIKHHTMKTFNYLYEKYGRKKIRASRDLCNALEMHIINLEKNHGKIDYWICGHKHPTETFDVVLNNTRYIVGKRGLTILGGFLNEN